MELQELINKVEKVSEFYADKFNIKRDNDWFLLKIQEELGELIQKYLIMTERGRKKNLSETQIREDFETELADLLCQVLLLVNYNNVDVITRIENKWLKRLEPSE
jgi:NTP pyrophosphatase (non-canonical NTP hydrolase)